jgi:hypothetical protein
MIITLPANQKRIEAVHAAYEARKTDAERLAFRREIADSDNDWTRVSLSDGKFIDLTVHLDSFLDDAAIWSDTTADVPLAWKSRHAPMTGVTTGSTLGGGTRTIYTVQDNSAFLTPMVVDVPGEIVPRRDLTVTPDKMGIRDAALARQAEALELKIMTFQLNVMTGSRMGAAIADSVTNYANLASVNGGPYGVLQSNPYVIDPGVQSGTYETSNIVDGSALQGLTSQTFELLGVQEYLSGRNVQTIHLPKQGMAWRKLLREALIVATSSPAGATTVNPGLKGIPYQEFEKRWNMSLNDALAGGQGLIIELFGRKYKIKVNNALPQGYAICTTDRPALEVFNVTDRSISRDKEANDYWSETHEESRMMAFGAPDPWRRNWFLLLLGNLSF